MNGRVYSATLGVFTSADPAKQGMADTQSGNGYAYARGNPVRYIDPNGFGWVSDFIHNPGKALGNLANGIGRSASDFWNGVSHFAGEVGKWWSENWRIVVVVVVVIVVEVVTFGAATAALGPLAGAILTGMAAGAAGGALGAALYGGSPSDILQAAVKGAVIGGASAAAFYGVGSAFGAVKDASTTTQIESIAAHGAVGGAKSAAEG